MTKEEQFVNELIGYIFAYPDDDYMTMECLCRKLHKHELIEKVDGHWQPLDKRCEDCIFVEGSHWCDGCDKTPKGMKEYDEYFAKARRKTESSSEIPNNSTISKMEQVDKDINVRSKGEPQTDIHGITDCDFCKHESEEWDSEACDGCCNANNHFEPKDEPQTETEIARAIVHKMIDDAVLAEDAYPNLRQKMHDAVDEYEPQTDCAWR